MHRLSKYLFFALIAGPFVRIGLGLNIRHRERLPKGGPAVIVANHNSHLDTVVLMSLFPIRVLGKVRPIAAADYFLRSRVMTWFSTRIIDIIPVQRKRREAGEDPFASVTVALEEGAIVILFPEGTRGEPERMADFKKGVSYLAERHAGVPFVPVFLRGLGKALPKGAWLPVPFFCDVFVGEPAQWSGNREIYMEELKERMRQLEREGQPSSWE
jgi:1-acyl-sn-glycerol-3-phosphate acyltransferase